MIHSAQQITTLHLNNSKQDTLLPVVIDCCHVAQVSTLKKWPRGDLIRNENLVERSDQNRLRYDRIRPDKTRPVPNKFHRRSTTLLPKDSPPCWRTSNSVDSRSNLLHSFPNGPFLHLFHLFFFFYSQIFSNCFVFILIFCRSTGWTAPPAWQQRLKPLLENSSSQFLACTRS